jgi:ribosome recycling factor
MTEDLNTVLEDAKATMKKAIGHFESELTKIRAGKATPTMLDGIVVDYYGTPTEIGQVGNITAMDARTLTIQPWEKNMLQPIERAIIAANIGMKKEEENW